MANQGQNHMKNEELILEHRTSAKMETGNLMKQAGEQLGLQAQDTFFHYCEIDQLKALRGGCNIYTYQQGRVKVIPRHPRQALDNSAPRLGNLQLDIESKMPNLTSTSEFLLLGFSDIRELQILHFFVFLAVYLVAVTGNLLIITAVALDHHLHMPMYFFLMNLAILDLGSISVILPKAMANFLINSMSISYSGCVAQVFCLFLFVGANFAMLTIMAHDRHMAICHPLQYETIMHKGACVQMAASAWVSGILNGTLHTGGTFAINFCSNRINQFFCETSQILKLSCSDLYLIEIGILLFSCSLAGGCFIYIIIT
ncbi:PREDICTED: olfactory receptor 14A16-like [Gekko japonicus]|uniref:Olfactory receptor 14A16-like n=1 Tax=Gekko japonicus TaxID=146911 RepID=A0ABM1KNV7_GEKJA|nr:PREDICTED: olfactory receptor 14A16-like [Gekko japonicus]